MGDLLADYPFDAAPAAIKVCLKAHGGTEDFNHYAAWDRFEYSNQCISPLS